MPAVASTDSAKPDRDRERRAGPAAARSPRRPGCGGHAAAPSVPSATSATAPITAARSTLGSVRASSTNPTMPAAPTSSSQRPRTPAPARQPQQAADHQRQVGAADRPAGGSGRWSGSRRPPPGPRARRRRRRPAPAPAPARGPDGARHESRSDARTAPAPRHHRSGGARTRGAPLACEDRRQVVAVGDAQAPARPPRWRPAGRRAHVRRREHQHRGAQRVDAAPALDLAHADPQPTPSAYGPSSGRGSPVTVATTRTTARSAGQVGQRPPGRPGRGAARCSPRPPAAPAAGPPPSAARPPPPRGQHRAGREHGPRDPAQDRRRCQGAQQPADPGRGSDQRHPQVGPDRTGLTP